MRMQLKVLYILVFTALFASVGLEKIAHAGLIMEQVDYQQGDSNKQSVTIYLQNNKSKQIQNGGPFPPTVIMDLNSGDIMYVNHEKKLYIFLNREEYIKYMGSVMSENKTDTDVSRKVTLKKTDESASIAGYNSKKYEIYENGKLQSEYWVSNDPVFYQEIDLDKMSKLMSDLKGMSQNVGGSASISDDEYKIFKEINEGGYTMKAVYHSPDSDKVFVEEIVSVKKQDIPQSEFQPPAGYEKITYQDILKQK
jgi:hypothetical protein